MCCCILGDISFSEAIGTAESYVAALSITMKTRCSLHKPLGLIVPMISADSMSLFIMLEYSAPLCGKGATSPSALLEMLPGLESFN